MTCGAWAGCTCPLKTCPTANAATRRDAPRAPSASRRRRLRRLPARVAPAPPSAALRAPTKPARDPPAGLPRALWRGPVRASGRARPQRVPSGSCGTHQQRSRTVPCGLAAGKQALRRRLGRAHLGRDLEDQLPQVALVANLHYVRILCGNLDQLPQAFAALDCPAKPDPPRLQRNNRDAPLRRRNRA